MEKIVLVTGAAGFIGRVLVRRLMSEGTPVRVLVRRPEALGGLRDHVEVVRGDVRDRGDVARAVRGAGLVYHLAGCAKAWSRDEGEFHAVNVEGVRHVLDAAREHGVERVVHTSTVLTLLPFSPGPVRGIAAPPTPYEETKRAADRLVEAHVARGGDALTVHPTRVFGPGPLHDANGATKLIAAYLAGWFRFRLSDRDVRANYVFVEDVAAGMVQAAHEGVPGGRYTLGGENVSIREFLGVIDRVIGTARWTLPLAPRISAAVAGAAELWGRLGGTPFITRGWVRTYLQDHSVPIEDTVRALGYRPRPLEERIRETVEWLGGERRLPDDVARPRYAAAR